MKQLWSPNLTPGEGSVTVCLYAQPPMRFARGGLVNNKDLLDAIEQGIVSTYVTDFPDEELLANDNVIPIPHLGASTPESEENCAVMAVNQLRDFLENGNIRNSVNFPECVLPHSGQKPRSTPGEDA